MVVAYLKKREKPMQIKKTEAKRGMEKWWTAHPPTVLTTFVENLGSFQMVTAKEKRKGKPPAHPLIRTKEKTVTPEASHSAESKSLPVAHPPSRTYPSP
jgi:hypothetical protein